MCFMNPEQFNSAGGSVLEKSHYNSRLLEQLGKPLKTWRGSIA